MVGPGHGANIEMIIKSLTIINSFQITLFANEYKFNKNQYPLLSVITYGHTNKFVKRFTMIKKMINMQKYDILFILGGTNLYETIPAIFLFKYNFLIFDIWSESIPKILGNKSKYFKRYFYRLVMNKCNIIICSWEGTYNKLIKNYPKVKEKTYILRDGIGDSITQEQPIKTEYAQKYLNSLPKDKIIFLNQRSISEYNTLELQVKALKYIVENYPFIGDDILFIIWQGNNFDKSLYNRITKYIKDNSLENIIKIILHPYLPASDIAHIIKSADVIVNLVYHDQLSNSIIETMYFQKQGLLSDIEPYRILNEKYDTKFNLTKLNSKNIAEEIIHLYYLCKSGEKDIDLLDRRKKVVEKYFDLKTNAYEFEKIITDLYIKKC